MPNYTKNFTIGWSIGLVALVIFNLFMFLAPALYDVLISFVGSLEGLGILLVILLWPLFLVATGLAIFAIIIAIIIDIIVLGIFYSAQKKNKLA